MHFFRGPWNDSKRNERCTQRKRGSKPRHIVLSRPEQVWNRCSKRDSLFECRLRNICVNICHIAQFTDQGQFLPSVSTFLTSFLLYTVVLSDQEVSGSSEDSYRKLRVYSFRLEKLVNMCWPFRQHVVSYKICIIGKMHIFWYRKKQFLIHTMICSWDHDFWSLYHRKWEL